MPSFSSISSSLTYIRSWKNSFDLIEEEMSKFEKDNTSNSTTLNNLSSTSKEIEIKNLTFSYSEKKTGISIKDISLNVKKGEMVGIIGKSGAGKSTLINIILKLIEPDKGEINFNFKSSKKNGYLPVSFVPQDIYLFDDSIRNNIALGIEKELIDDKKVIQCLKDSEMWDYVKNNPAGLDLLVGDRGIRLSGGEKQRIGLARALYPNPEVLILDEATSSLDIPTERKIVNTIKKFKNKLTIIVVAHRLSTLKDCDKIHFIENGMIKDNGSLSDILARNPNLN